MFETYKKNRKNSMPLFILSTRIADELNWLIYLWIILRQWVKLIFKFHYRCNLKKKSLLYSTPKVIMHPNFTIFEQYIGNIKWTSHLSCRNSATQYSLKAEIIYLQMLNKKKSIDADNMWIEKIADCPGKKCFYLLS